MMIYRRPTIEEPEPAAPLLRGGVRPAMLHSERLRQLDVLARRKRWQQEQADHWQRDHWQRMAEGAELVKIEVGCTPERRPWWRWLVP